MGGQTYRDLEVWQKSMDLVVEVYEVSKLFPKEEQFGLTNQIRRAAVSVPSNIAEGQGRLHEADFLRFLSIARGSLTETETQLMIAMRLAYVSKDQVRQAWILAQQVGRLLNGLIRSKRPTANGNGRISEPVAPFDIDYGPEEEFFPPDTNL
jgi:four helix bundle protein